MFLISVMALLPALAFAGWIRTYGTAEYGEIGRCVRQTSDGGYIITANYPNDSTESTDIWLIKTDSLGNIMWKKIYGEGGYDKPYCVQQTNDGGYVISGFMNIDVWMMVGDIWLLKTDPDGDTMWTRIYRGNCFNVGNWVEQTSDGGYILTGNYDMAFLLLLKTDKDGNTIWSQNHQWGSQQIETGYRVRQTTDGGYIVATNMGLFKTDDKGDSIWLKSVSSGCVDQTLDGGYIQATSHYADIWLVKTDTLGDTVWTRTYGGNDEDYSYDVQQTTDGGYVIVGETRSFGAGKTDVWLLKTDSIGDTLWTRTFGDKHNDHGYSVQQTADSGYVITGSFGEPLDYGFPNVWLIKTDSLGYVGVSEPVTPATHLDWEVISSIGQHITLRYTNRPQGFAADIYDAAGRKVDELRSSEQSGTIVWGKCYGCYGSGVYFIREESDQHPTVYRVVLIK